MPTVYCKMCTNLITYSDEILDPEEKPEFCSNKCSREYWKRYEKNNEEWYEV